MPEGAAMTTGSSRRDAVRTKRVIVLGSAGSVGTQTIEAIEHLNRLHGQGRFPHGFEVVGLATGRNAGVLGEQSRRLGVRDVALAFGQGEQCPGGTSGPSVRRGADAAERLVRDVGCDLVVGAVVGAAGLTAVLAALEQGVDVALANKESLVAAGALVVPLAARTGARLLPVDSEHAGVWQCLMSACGPGYSPPSPAPADVARVVLTASGGAFRGRSPGEVYESTAAEAMAHPTWSMGAKVTIDAATLMNKAFELIEAHWLFGLGAERLDAVLHPTSVVHALVEMGDGSVLAQLGAPDMRTPILRALAFPHRCPEALARMDVGGVGVLELGPIGPGWRRAVDLGLGVIGAGGDAGAVFNAANEAAVRAFMDGVIPFGRIIEVVEAVCGEHTASAVRTVADVQRADAWARGRAAGVIGAVA